MAWPCPARQNRWRGYACICDRAPGSQLNLDDNDTFLEPEQHKLLELNGLQREKQRRAAIKQKMHTDFYPATMSLIYVYLFIKTVISDNLTLTTSFFAPQNANKNKIRRGREGEKSSSP
jgi:hypothetical protein